MANPTTRVDRFVAWAKSNSFISSVLIGGLCLSGVAFGVEKMRVIASLWQSEPNALALSLGLEKGEFSRQLTERAWRRLFRARLFIARVNRNAGVDWVDEAWRRYVDATEEWSSHLMIDLQLLSTYYPDTEKRYELEGPIQNSWSQLEEALIALRYMQPGDPNRSKFLAAATARANTLNAELYSFVSGLEPPREAPH